MKKSEALRDLKFLREMKEHFDLCFTDILHRQMLDCMIYDWTKELENFIDNKL